MLKSTYRASAQTPAQEESPLPEGWTEHKAPTGHTYYYNAATQQSTYTRPAAPPPADEPFKIDYGATEPDHVMRASLQVMDEFNRSNPVGAQPGHFTGGRSYQEHSRRRGNQGDRPKSKEPIPDCAPWVLVKTKLGRRFVHNTETKQSLWKFPQDIMMKVIDMDRMEWEAKKAAEAAKEEEARVVESEPLADEDGTANAEALARPRLAPSAPEEYDSDSYEEVEVTDDDAEGADQDGQPAKRPRIPQEESEPTGPLELGEDDIAWQLAQMEGDYDDADDDPDANGLDNVDPADDEEGLPLTDQDNIYLFRSLLDASGISPYSTFERLIESPEVVEDHRYVALPTTTARREAFTQWSRDRIAEIQQVKAEETVHQNDRKQDPRVPYLKFLQQNATPKLYWPEFKRKFKKSSQMQDRHLDDKTREKLYRELVAKLKLSESDRRKDLVALLKDTARSDRHGLSRGMKIEDLPDGVLRDVKFYAVEQQRRDELVGTFLATIV
jgi:hypothetical protein